MGCGVIWRMSNPSSPSGGGNSKLVVGLRKSLHASQESHVTSQNDDAQAVEEEPLIVIEQQPLVEDATAASSLAEWRERLNHW